MAMDLFEAAYWLRIVDNQGYGSLRIPSPRDGQITTLLRTCIALDAKDRSNGSSRLLLLKAFRKSKTDVAKKAIEDLVSDPDLAKEIATWGTGGRGKRGVGPNQAIE